MFKTWVAVAFGTVIAAAIAAPELPKALVDPYLQIQAGLAADKIDGLATHAKAIESAAAALGSDAGSIVSGAKKLGAAKDIAAARTAFGELSDAVISYAEKAKLDLGDIRVAYCPMINKPWLQRDKEIKNPYYGSAMLTCGSFRTKN